MFACNVMLGLHDDTRGTWWRWLLIKVPFVFGEAEPTAKDSNAQEHLEDHLITEVEFAGLLARRVEGFSA